MAKTHRKRKAAGRGKQRDDDARAIDNKLLREIALQLPDVEDGTTERGAAFKARGRLLACAAIHDSAEPRSLVVHVSAEQRAQLMAAYPDALYLTDHYAKHPAVLARLARLDRDSLRDILGAAWLYVTEKALGRARRALRRKR